MIASVDGRAAVAGPLGRRSAIRPTARCCASCAPASTRSSSAARTLAGRALREPARRRAARARAAAAGRPPHPLVVTRLAHAGRCRSRSPLFAERGRADRVVTTEARGAVAPALGAELSVLRFARRPLTLLRRRRWSPERARRARACCARAVPRCCAGWSPRARSTTCCSRSRRCWRPATRRRSSTGARARRARRAGAARRPPRRRPPLPALRLVWRDRHALTPAVDAARPRFDLRPGRPLVMGIVNASPDSFSDAVRHATLDAQVALRAGAGRPRAPTSSTSAASRASPTPASTPPEVERERVVPLVRAAGRRGRHRLGRHLEARGRRRPRWTRGARAQRRQRACATRRWPTSRARDRRGAGRHAHARRAQAGALPRLRRRRRRRRGGASSPSAARWRGRAAWPTRAADRRPRARTSPSRPAETRRVAARDRPPARARPSVAGRGLAQVLPRRRSPAARRPSAWPARWRRVGFAADHGAAIVRVHDVRRDGRLPRGARGAGRASRGAAPSIADDER